MFSPDRTVGRNRYGFDKDRVRSYRYKLFYALRRSFLTAKLKHTKGFLFDLDGVLFIGDAVIPGAIETVQYLKNNNYPCRFLTNTTTRSFDSLYEKLNRLSLPIEKNELFSPPKIAVHYLKQIGKPSLCLILEDDTKSEFSDFPVNEQTPDYIVIGHYSDRWNYDLMQRLFDMVMNGSKILALHKGRYWQTDQGLTLDIGAFVAGLEHATGQKAIVIGKPSETFFKIALDDIGIKSADAVMIGDDIINDIKGAQEAGLKTILVKTGKYRQELIERANVTPDAIIDSIAKLQELL